MTTSTDPNAKAYLFLGYINQCIRNASHTYFKKKNKTNLLLIESLDDSYLDSKLTSYNIEFFLLNELDLQGIYELEKFVDNPQLSKGIAKLTKKEKMLIYNLFILQNTNSQLAKNSGISHQAVSKNKNRVLAKLKKDF